MNDAELPACKDAASKVAGIAATAQNNTGRRTIPWGGGGLQLRDHTIGWARLPTPAHIQL